MTNEERKYWEGIIEALSNTRKDLEELNDKLELKYWNEKLDEYCRTHIKDECYEDEEYLEIMENIERLENK